MAEMTWAPEREREVLERLRVLQSGRMFSGTEAEIAGQLARIDLPDALAEIERLKDELVFTQQAVRSAVESVNGQADEEVAALKSENALLLKDKERLDWREAHAMHGFGLYSDGEWADGKGGSHKTYRAAIDAAKEPK